MCCPSKRSERGSRRALPSEVKKAYLGYLLSVLLGAMIIKNLVSRNTSGCAVFFRHLPEEVHGRGHGSDLHARDGASAMMSWLCTSCAQTV